MQPEGTCVSASFLRPPPPTTTPLFDDLPAKYPSLPIIGKPMALLNFRNKKDGVEKGLSKK